MGGHDVGIGDRVNMAFMNTNVTRGHGEILVTTTGMGSEVGHIAHMLSGQKEEKTPSRSRWTGSPSSSSSRPSSRSSRLW
ncbi:hypothetical protein PJ267_18825 [Arthrobacter sp. OVS8]|nr:hypothetical protein PJ267_18825 [Arthrobacter sp. OVS8]